ncbi:MAG: DUF1905 domain-containing protein [Armatimonadetes bacterium]|nr:DUF1905 domain-containing protein [Armatimonadota bacterium]
MTLEFSGEIWYWKGPAPHHFVTVPAPQSKELKEISKMVTYGWGMIPVNVCIGGTEFYTALWEKDGHYIVPIKLSVRRAENLGEGDVVTLRMEVVQ